MASIVRGELLCPSRVNGRVQLTDQLPSFFFFLLGLFMWLNFFIVNDMYIYWPVVLVGLTVILLFLPFRVLYHRSRKWWAYSNVSFPPSGFTFT